MQRKTRILIAALLAIALAIWLLSRGVTVPTGGIGSADIPASASAGTLASKAGKFARAKEFVSPTGFLNVKPFTIASLVGHHVILVDFWTYSCINCLRTLPYLNDWYAKYKDKGLVIIGVHTPEFDFEKDIENVRTAVTKYGINYPVVLDSDRGTWNAYANQYWPHEYLIDVDGYIVHDAIGEGRYDETEKAIQTALNELMAREGMNGTADSDIQPPPGQVSIDFSRVDTPELYLGSSRNDGVLGNAQTQTVGSQIVTVPAVSKQKANTIYLGGTWNFSAEYIRSASVGAHIRLRYSAKQVNIVAGSASGVGVTVTRDGQSLIPGVAGADAPDGKSTIKDQRLYELIDDDSGYGEHTIDIMVDGPGLDVFTFTFG